MRLVLVLVLALAFAGVARAAPLEAVTLAPVADESLPFWCDWGYDWDERCYWDDSDRLRVGGVENKVWRAGVRFSLDALPADASVVTAELSLWYDGTCVGVERRDAPCDGRAFEVDAHPIFTSRWRSEREVEFAPAAASAFLDAGAPAGRLAWEVTDVVADWWSGGLANDGILLKLADEEEGFGVSGPAFPSSGYPDASLRPRLTIWFVRE
jgi:hypothetical protein